MSRLLRNLVALFVSALVALPWGSAPATSAPPRTAGSAHAPVLGTGVVLFIDDHRVAGTRNVARQYLPGTKVHVGRLPPGRIAVSPVRHYLGAGPAADAADGDHDVDSRALLAVNTVLREDVDGHPFYRMWLRSGSNTGYRESTDGIHWHPHDADSVIVVRGIVGVAVLRDPTSGRYLMIGADRPHRRFVELISDDGIHFSRAAHFSGPLAHLEGDLVTGAFVGDKAVTLAKQATLAGSRCSHNLRTGGRTFAMESSTPASGLQHWSRVVRHVGPDCIDERSMSPTPGTRHPVQIYGLPFQRYGDQYLGFPWLFHLTTLPRTPATSGWVDGPVDSQLASSPNPLTHGFVRTAPVIHRGTRRARPTLIARGPAGSWDSGMLYAASAVDTPDGRTLVYYTGWNSEHLPVAGRRARIGAAEWPQGRFVGLRVASSSALGEVRTRSFTLAGSATGRSLYLNARLAAGASLTVGVRDAVTHHWVAGFTPAESSVTTGNSLATEVTWQGRTLGQLAGRSLELVFGYGTGSLYSFQVR